jgi:hypothetical protein
MFTRSFHNGFLGKRAGRRRALSPNAAPPTMEGGGSVEAEAQLYELARTAGLEISPDMFAVVLDLLRLDVLPQGIIALLRALKDLRLRAPVAVAEVR